MYRVSNLLIEKDGKNRKIERTVCCEQMDTGTRSLATTSLLIVAFFLNSHQILAQGEPLISSSHLAYL
jgi:hypothetical protein